jgi:uncharacterized protein (DUF1778 family)
MNQFVSRETIRSAVCRETQEGMMLETETVYLVERDWNALLAALDSPPAPNKRLRDLLRSKALWDD